MEHPAVFGTAPAPAGGRPAPPSSAAEAPFICLLDSRPGPGSEPRVLCRIPLPPLSSAAVRPAPSLASTAPKAASEAYKRHADASPLEATPLGSLEKYRDDQLLSNPGGDHYDLKEMRMDPTLADQGDFAGRVGKDLRDAFGNVRDFFRNLSFGASFHYRGGQGRISRARHRGLLGCVADFFKDAGSALSLGLWRPDGEDRPRGVFGRLGFAFSKMKEAVCADLLHGVGSTVVHLAENAVFAGLNLLEAVPDATLGNCSAGRRLTTALFDNGQVLLDYLTDVLPFGEAWIRVHSADLKSPTPPVLCNTAKPEKYEGDRRWQYVRNTPFRKTIETIGALVTDVLTLKVLGRMELFADDSSKKH